MVRGSIQCDRHANCTGGMTVHLRARGEPAALANNIDHIIKSPPLMSRDAPVM